MERHGIAYCADEFAKGVQTQRIVCARPVFSREAISQTALPLAALYDHPDYIDLISAGEFGLEALFPGSYLQCILVAQIPQALDEMESMIHAPTPCKAGASAWSTETGLHVRQDGEELVLPLTENAGTLLTALQEKCASPAAVLAAVTEWCVGYPLRLYWPEALQ